MKIPTPVETTIIIDAKTMFTIHCERCDETLGIGTILQMKSGEVKPKACKCKEDEDYILKEV